MEEIHSSKIGDEIRRRDVETLTDPEREELRPAAVAEFTNQVHKDCFGTEGRRFGQIVQSLCLVYIICECTHGIHSRVTTGPSALNIR